jgi:hypothetical protein
MTEHTYGWSDGTHTRAGVVVEAPRLTATPEALACSVPLVGWVAKGEAHWSKPLPGISWQRTGGKTWRVEVRR